MDINRMPSDIAGLPVSIIPEIPLAFSQKQFSKSMVTLQYFISDAVSARAGAFFQKQKWPV